MSVGRYRGYGSRARRFGLGACAAGLALAVAPAAASAEVSVSLSGPQGPILKGETAKYTATVTNDDPFVQPDLRLLLGSYRVGTDRPAPNPYTEFSSTPGSCAREDFPSKFGTYYSLNCGIGTLAPGASARVTATAQINESMRQWADVEPGDGRDELVTYVSAPPTIEGSTKLKLKGLPDGCASDAFKLKVKAKGAKKITGRVDGPRFADGKPATQFVEEGGSDKLKPAKKGKLKAKIAVDGLEPDLYYEIDLKAKYKHGPKQKTTILFQVCA